MFSDYFIIFEFNTGVFKFAKIYDILYFGKLRENMNTVADDSEKKARRVSVKSRSVRDQMWSAIIALRCSTPVQRMRTMRSDAPVTTEVSSTSGTDCLSRTLQCGSGVFQ